MTIIASRFVPTVDTYTGVDRKFFSGTIVARHRPAILRQLVADWSVVRMANQSPKIFADYLRRHARTEPVQTWYGGADGRFGYSADLRGFDFERRSIPLAQLLDQLLAQLHAPSAPAIYAGAIPLPRFLPGLLDETPMPLLLPEQERLVSLWIGNGSRVAAHWDLPQNLACVVRGTRRFILFPPDQIDNLYIGPLDVTLAGQPSSLVNIFEPDLVLHPRYQTALAVAQVAELAPGDALYLPSLWWHHVDSSDRLGAQINFWWRDGPMHMLSPLFTLYHALMTMRDLPADERAAWRSFFDHYVFQTGHGPTAHLPPASHGVLGPMTPELIRQISNFVARSLNRG